MLIGKKNSGESPAKISYAWQCSDLFSVEATLNAWEDGLGRNDIECALQRVYFDSALERESQQRSVHHAERMARAFGDEIALARIAAAVVDALYSDWRPSREAQRWLDVLRSVAFARLQSLPPSVRLQVAVGLLAADLFGEALAVAPHVAASVPIWCREAPEVAASFRGNALGYALEYFSGRRDWVAVSEIVTQIDALDDESGFGALARARVASRRGFYFHYRRGDYAGALAHSLVAVKQARLATVSAAAREAGITVTLCHLMRGESAEAERALVAEHASIPAGHLMMRANVHYGRSWWHALRRDSIAAQLELDTACRLFAEIDEHGVMSLATPSLQAQLLVQVQEYEAALRVYEMRLRRPDAWLVDIAMIDSLVALSKNEQARAVERLTQGLAIASRIDIKGFFWACRDELSSLLRLAIEHHIQPDWVRAVLKARLIELG